VRQHSTIFTASPIHLSRRAARSAPDCLGPTSAPLIPRLRLGPNGRLDYVEPELLDRARHLAEIPEIAGRLNAQDRGERVGEIIHLHLDVGRANNEAGAAALMDCGNSRAHERRTAVKKVTKGTKTSMTRDGAEQDRRGKVELSGRAARGHIIDENSGLRSPRGVAHGPGEGCDPADHSSVTAPQKTRRVARTVRVPQPRLDAARAGPAQGRAGPIRVDRDPTIVYWISAGGDFGGLESASLHSPRKQVASPSGRGGDSTHRPQTPPPSLLVALVAPLLVLMGLVLSHLLLVGLRGKDERSGRQSSRGRASGQLYGAPRSCHQISMLAWTWAW